MGLSGARIAVEYQIAPVFDEIKRLEYGKCLACIGGKRVGIYLVEIPQLGDSGVFDALLVPLFCRNSGERQNGGFQPSRPMWPGTVKNSFGIS